MVFAGAFLVKSGFDLILADGARALFVFEGTVILRVDSAWRLIG